MALFDFAELEEAQSSLDRGSGGEATSLLIPQLSGAKPAGAAGAAKGGDWLRNITPSTAVPSASTSPRSSSDDAAFDFDKLDKLDAALEAAAAATASPSSSSSSPPASPDAEAAAAHATASTLRSSAALASAVASAAASATRSGGAAAAGGAVRARIAMLSNGSRGDVQPLVALAKSLKMRGHEVCVFTNINLVSFCEQHGVNAVAVFHDTQAVIAEAGGMHGGSVAGQAHCVKAMNEWQERHQGALAGCDASLEAFAPSVILFGALASDAAIRYEKAHGVTTMCIFFDRRSMEYFEGNLHLIPTRPHFFAKSSLLESAPITAPGRTDLHHVGEFVLEERVTPQQLAPGGPLAGLKDFLSAGSKPVVFSWGSMVAHGLSPPGMLRLALRSLVRSSGAPSAAAETGGGAAAKAAPAERRAVVLGGWARLDELGQQLLEGKLPSDAGHEGGEDDDAMLAEYARRNVFFVPSAPHAWLLPRCCCMVHHGGAGTTQAALRAGLPAVVTPIFGDQFDNAKCVRDLSAGCGFQVPLPRIDAAQLADALFEVLGGKRAGAMRAGARKAEFQLQGESGVHAAARIVHDYIVRSGAL